MVYQGPDSISTTFAALADPTRRAILARLALGEASVTELAEPFEMSMPAVSKHLRVLERAGLVARGREAQWRPVRLCAEPLQQAAGWLEEYRRLWEQSFDRLEAYLQRLQGTEPKRSRAARGQRLEKQQSSEQKQKTGKQGTGKRSKEKSDAAARRKN